MSVRRPISPRRAERGTVLVMALAVSAIVGVIGLSSLLAVRLQHRDVQARAASAQAQLLSDSALRVVHARLVADGDWRNTYTHDVWSPAQPFDGGSQLSFKLVDQRDTDLADDVDDPARLFVRLTSGGSVRLASVLLAGGVQLGPELVVNGDIEQGTAGFEPTFVGGALSAQHLLELVKQTLATPSQHGFGRYTRRGFDRHRRGSRRAFAWRHPVSVVDFRVHFSADLVRRAAGVPRLRVSPEALPRKKSDLGSSPHPRRRQNLPRQRHRREGDQPRHHRRRVHGTGRPLGLRQVHHAAHDLSLIHISEPTRPERIAYAVFCWKKKK